MKRIFSILFALALVLGFSLVATTPVAANTLEVGPGKTYATIQAAVDAASPGDTILVAAGTYNENVDVNKQVTINGAGAANTIVTAANNQDHVFEVTADGVSISNLTATGANYNSYTYREKSGIFVKKASGTISSVTISGVTASANNIGIYLDHASGSTVTGCTATNNKYRGIYLKWSDGNIISGNNASSNDVTGSWSSTSSWAGIGIYLEYCCNNDLTGNTANANKGGGSNSGIGIYLDKSGSSDVCSVLTGNTANENACLSNMEMSGIGILLWQAGGTASDHTVLTGNTANANIYNGTGKEKSGSGIVLYQSHYADVTGNTVQGNQNSGYYSEGAIGNFVHDNVVTGNTATGNKYGFHLCNDRSNYSNNTITGNTDTGIHSRAYGGMSLTGTVLRANNISGNALFGARFTSWSVDDRLDARYNWWGADDGPDGVGPGGGDAVSDNVNYVPWATKTATGTGNAYLTPSVGDIEDLTHVATPAGAPAVFPHGMFSFKITGIGNGEEVALTIELPDPVPVGTKWWKYQGGSWYSLPIGDDDGDNIITVTLTDNGLGDEDPTDGQIIDDGGPGSGAVGWETYPISKVRVLLPWIALFAAIIVGVSLLVLRRRRAQI